MKPISSMSRSTDNRANKLVSLALRLALLTVASTLVFPTTTQAQETFFGKNKVVYRDFDWRYIQSDHFDIYYYDEQYDLAKFSVEVLEDAYVSINAELDYSLRSRIPVFIYLSANDFQTTNITQGLLPEGVNGFTEVFKKRVVVHFNGSYEDYRHLLHHELTHAVIYDLIFGKSFSSIISRSRLFDLPLWFAEGYAEYSSRKHWHYRSDMITRDATISGYLRPPGYMGILAYSEGAALVGYIVNTYGEDKLGEILRKGKIMLSMKKAVRAALGIKLEKLYDDFTLELRKRYWPEIAQRQKPAKIAKALTHHGKDQSFFNEKPQFSPKGNQLAIFSDRSDYTEIFLISAIDGKQIQKVTRASRSGDLESLHSYFSGMTFSPDGKNLCFVAKSNGYDALFFIRLDGRKTYLKKRVNSNGLLSPIWSPDGSRVAFSGLTHGQRDLFVFDIENDVINQLTNDRHDDRDASWTANSEELIFSSDRPHPENNVARDVEVSTTGVLRTADGAPLEFGAYNLFRLKLDGGEVSPLPVGEGDNGEPTVSPDGKKICFVSNRNGIDNLYLHFFDSSGAIAITDILTGAGSPSWSPDGRRIAFSSFNEGGFDIFLLKDILPAGNNGQLIATDYYANYESGWAGNTPRFDTTAMVWSLETLQSRQGPGHMKAARRSLVEEETDASEKIAFDSSGVAESGDYVFVSRDPESESESESDDDGEKSDESVESVESEDEGTREDGEVSGEIVNGEVISDEIDPLEDLLTDVDEAEDSQREYPETDVSVTDNRDGDEYVVRPYKVKFTPDFMAGGMNYDTFFGLRGQSFFAFSDYLGNHQFYLVTDIANSLDQSNVQVYYFNNTRRTRFGGGIFHTKNFYLDNSVPERLFSDRFYGLRAFASRPFSVFSRLEFGASLTFIDRQYHDFTDPRPDRSTKATLIDASYTHDNVLWGLTGPINGSRSKFTLTAAKDFLSSENVSFRNLSFYSAELDHRRYWHLYRSFSAAFRVTGGASFGSTPKQYFLGGTTNWIGRSVDNADVFEVENLYFSDVVTPLRGWDYYELSGNRYFLTNFEFRYPFLDYLQLHFPLPLTIARVQGVGFFDFGAAWNGDEFRFSSSDGGFHLVDARAGFGWGLRANLGFLLLRYDMAWATDFDTVSPKPKSYFSFGADF